MDTCTCTPTALVAITYVSFLLAIAVVVVGSLVLGDWLGKKVQRYMDGG